MSEPPRGRPEGASSLHKPVLLRETLALLDLAPGQIVVDGTVGGGGHSQKILETMGPAGTLVGLDRDPMMLRLAGAKVGGPNCHLVHSSYAQLPDVLHRLGLPAADRVLLDLGLSSDQLADRERGFGFQTGGPLDLRFDVSQGTPAWQLIEQLDQPQLADLLRTWGEEPQSDRIAAALVARRPVRTAEDLVAAVEAALPGKYQRDARKHPATRVFQALRIAANEELTQLEHALNHALPAAIPPGGRAVIITFHSLEDRLVKDAFRDHARWENLTPRPVTASPLEQKMNPRSRTAKLRAARRR